ncbi:MAG: 50S ribosomal protein L25/general stress protein Ctc [Myxococcota bacterium]
MAENEIQAEIREATGKGVARKIRATGRIPGVCYGQAQESQPITVDPKALDDLIRKSTAGLNTLINLKVAGGGAYDGKKVLLKEMQRDPVTNRPLHADFYAIELTHKIDVAVPIHVSGTAPGVTMGGILDQVLREVHLECLPDAIPEEVVADVSALELGMSIHIRDLMLPEGVELRSDPDLSVISVVAPKTVEEETPADEEVAEGEEAAPTGEDAAASAESTEAADEKSGD